MTPRLISHLRAQFSRDLRESYTNTTKTLVKVTDIIDGIGRSDQLPRATREHRGQLAETLSLDTSRHSFKFGLASLGAMIHDNDPDTFNGAFNFGGGLAPAARGVSTSTLNRRRGAGVRTDVSPCIFTRQIRCAVLR